MVSVGVFTLVGLLLRSAATPAAEHPQRHVLYCASLSSLPRGRGLAKVRAQKELTHTIMLHPSYFGPRMREFLLQKLYADVEGTCSGQFGYIITVIDVVNIGSGIVLPGSGQAEFITRYRAIVFKPFKGEVVDGVVNNVVKVRAFACATISYRACLTAFSSDGLLRRRRTIIRIRVQPGTLHGRVDADTRKCLYFDFSSSTLTCDTTPTRILHPSRQTSMYVSAPV